MPVAIVTGSDSGIGKATAVRLAQDGFDVGITYNTDEEGAQGTAEEVRELGRRAEVRHLNLGQAETGGQVIGELADALGGLDVLVNNAGGSIRGAALDVTEADFADVWALNVRSTFFLSQHAARHMRDHGGGAVVNVASQAGLVALPGEPSYCTAKAAVVHMTRCLALEWGPLGIRVNAVAPTFIETDGTAPVLSDEEFRAATVDRIAALHRIGSPDEVSAAVVFLASPAASLVTGHPLVVDGGWTLP